MHVHMHLHYIPSEIVNPPAQKNKNKPVSLVSAVVFPKQWFLLEEYLGSLVYPGSSFTPALTINVIAFSHGIKVLLFTS